MNPLWILALLAVGRKKNNTSNPSPPANNPGNPASQDDYLDRM